MLTSKAVDFKVGLVSPEFQTLCFTKVAMDAGRLQREPQFECCFPGSRWQDKGSGIGAKDCR